MAVIPVQVPVSTTVPTLTLAAGSAGGLAVAVSVDPVNDYIPIYTASATATQGINRNTYLGLSSAPIGTTDVQTLTNKTIGITNTITAQDSTFIIQDNTDATKKLQLQLSGITTGTTRTLTIPDATDTITVNAATQTLTNKTLTSPIITAPTITNATISADAVTGFSTSNTGTIYGFSIVGGTPANNSILPAALATAIPYTKFSNPYKFSVYRTSAQTSVNANTLIQFDTKVFDTSSNVDIVTNKGRFTAPVTGFYWFDALAGNTTAGTTPILIFLYKNGSLIKQGNGAAGSTTSNGTYASIGGLLSLTATDYVEVYFVGGNGSTMGVGQSLCYFDGFLMSVT